MVNRKLKKKKQELNRVGRINNWIVSLFVFVLNCITPDVERVQVSINYIYMMSYKF